MTTIKLMLTISSFKMNTINNNYKWQLKKGGKKEVCPACGQKRFVPFVLSSDNETPAGSEYGRCDREDHCGYFRYPGKEVETPQQTNYQQTNFKEKKMKKIIIPDYFLNTFAFKRDDHLFEYFSKKIDPDKLENIFKKYHVGTTNKGETVFFQIDTHKKIHAAKIIDYNSDTGHRRKDVPMPARWLHKDRMYSSGFDGQELWQCFFGQELINESENIMIVESEKTALLLNLINPYGGDEVYIATGGANNLNMLLSRYGKLLKYKNLYSIPDEGKYYQWLRIFAQNNKSVKMIKCEEYTEGSGEDIIDVIERSGKW